MKAIPKRNFLLKQVEGKDVIAKKGIAIDVTEQEFKRHADSLEAFKDEKKKK